MITRYTYVALRINSKLSYLIKEGRIAVSTYNISNFGAILNQRGQCQHLCRCDGQLCVVNSKLVFSIDGVTRCRFNNEMNEAIYLFSNFKLLDLKQGYLHLRRAREIRFRFTGSISEDTKIVQLCPAQYISLPFATSPLEKHCATTKSIRTNSK